MFLITDNNEGFPDWWLNNQQMVKWNDDLAKGNKKLYKSGDLITYKYHHIDLKASKLCEYSIYYFPKENRIYYQESWHTLYMDVNTGAR